MKFLYFFLIGVDIASVLQQEVHDKHWDTDSAIETEDGSLTSCSFDEDKTRSRILGGVSLVPQTDSANGNDQ